MKNDGSQARSKPSASSKSWIIVLDQRDRATRMPAATTFLRASCERRLPRIDPHNGCVGDVVADRVAIPATPVPTSRMRISGEVTPISARSVRDEGRGRALRLEEDGVACSSTRSGPRRIVDEIERLARGRSVRTRGAIARSRSSRPSYSSRMLERVGDSVELLAELLDRLPRRARRGVTAPSRGERVRARASRRFVNPMTSSNATDEA